MAEKHERRSFVRYPLTLFVDQITFDPETYSGDVIRTAYDIDLTVYDAQQLYEKLKEHLEKKPQIPIRIRVIGRLVS